jgi:hypothetical protein
MTHFPASVITSKPANDDRVNTPDPVLHSSSLTEAGQASPFLVRQLFGPHFNANRWWGGRSSMALKAARQTALSFIAPSTGAAGRSSVLLRDVGPAGSLMARTKPAGE